MRKKRIGFALAALGWALIYIALIMGAVFCIGSDHKLYYRLQIKYRALDSAGISSADMLDLDERLSDYLFKSMRADMAFDNREIEVYGRMQPPFNERELAHLHDCRRLLAPTAQLSNYLILAGMGLALISAGRRRGSGPAWAATAILLIPLALFGLWAAIDFNSAFTFFHRLLFTNDLWLLDPRTDLLIRICPSGMFASMGLRIGLCAALILLGIPALQAILPRIFKRRKRNPL